MVDIAANIDALLSSTSTRIRFLSENVPMFEVFDGLKGWEWDKMRWPSERTRNIEAAIPTLVDPQSTNAPDHIFQSGIGSADDLELVRIEDLRPAEEGWAPHVRGGTYFVHRDRFWLHSEHSVMVQCGRALDANGRSQLDLWFEPRPGTPITVAHLSHDTNGDVLFLTEFRKVAKFTGLVQNGTELDPDLDVNNVDVTQDEFVVEQRADRYKEAERLVAAEPAIFPGIATILLDEAPISVYGSTLSRRDIFVTELGHDEFVARQQAGTLQVGDHFIGWVDSTAPPGVIQVWTGSSHATYGSLSYAYAYPATITWNRNVRLSRVGATIGLTNGTDGQRILLDRFPVLDQTDGQVLDVWSFVLTIQGDPNPWTRVQDLSQWGPDDRVYTLDPDNGIVVFGDNVNGMVPANLSNVLATYDHVPYVEYDPADSEGVWRDEGLDLDPVSNSLVRGFLWLSNRRQLADHLHLSAPLHTVQADGTLGPIVAGQELIHLTAEVHDLAHNPIPNVEVVFDADPDNVGSFVATTRRTDDEGRAYAQWLPSSGFEALAERVDFYQPRPDVQPGDPGFPEGWPANVLIPVSAPLGADQIVDRDVSASFAPALAWSGTGPAWQDNAIVVPATIPAELDSEGIGTVTTYAVLNDDPLDPFDNSERTGGRSVLLARLNAQGSWSVLRPVAVLDEGATSVVVFDRNLTTKDTSASPNIERSVMPSQNPAVLPAAGWYNAMQMLVVSDRIVRFQAETVDPPVLASNSLSFDVGLPSTMRGEWTLISPPDETAAAISADTWLWLNSEMEITGSENLSTPGLATGPAAGGYQVRIHGNKMPIDEELKPNVWVGGVLVPREDVSVVDVGGMEFEMPAGAPGEVEILVGGRPFDVGAGSDERVRTTTFTYT